jgi:hypothetical protein
MKRIKCFILIFCCSFLIFLTACPEAYSEYQIKRVINNQSSYDLKISAFRSDDLAEEYAIKSSESAISVADCSKERAHELCTPISLDWSYDEFYPPIDSVIILFSDNRKLVYCLEKGNCKGTNDVNRNIIMLNNYEPVTGKNVYTHTYTITDSDYEKAIPISE